MAQKSSVARNGKVASPRRRVAAAAPVSTEAAAKTAVNENLTRFRLPVLGEVSLPPVDHLVWYGAVAALTAAELLEWPVALVIAVGKVLADNRSHRTLRSLGEALEEAG